MSKLAEKDWSNTIALIGGGPAGCVLANRILATTNYEVLLLERGPSEPYAAATQDLSQFPVGLKHNAVWHSSIPQKGLNHRKIWANTASGLGGGSMLNGGIFMMGSKANYQNWPGKHFTAANFDRAIKEVCDIHKPKVISKGLLPKDTPAGKIETEIQKKFGFTEMTGKNLLWIEEDGMYFYNASAKEDSGSDAKIRRTAAESFLPDDVHANERFHLVTDAQVSRLLTEAGENGLKVTGLEYTTATKVAGFHLFDSTQTLSGFREVVCSAGAIETPRLLLRSGIGPPSELEPAGIPVALELDNVGKGLWDHPIAFFPVEIDSDKAPEDFPPCCTACDNNVTIKTYGNNKKVAFYHFGPNIAYHVPGEILVPRFEGTDVRRAVQVFMLNALRKVIYPVTNTKLGVVAVGLLTAQSKGSIGYDSIDPGYLTVKEDVETLADAYGDLLQMIKDAGMKVAVPDFEMNPPDRDALVASLRLMAGAAWHFAGSCPMGKVVDADSLRVKGTENLRIVDASVFPNVVEANTQAPIMAMAYLAGELFN